MQTDIQTYKAHHYTHPRMQRDIFSKIVLHNISWSGEFISGSLKGRGGDMLPYKCRKKRGRTPHIRPSSAQHGSNIERRSGIQPSNAFHDRPVNGRNLTTIAYQRITDRKFIL